MNFSKVVTLLLIILMLAGFSVKAFHNNEIEREVITLLKTREITGLANELAAKDSNSTKDLLIKISVFGRAGHHKRVLETLNKLIPKIKEIEAEDAQTKGVSGIKWRFLDTVFKATGGNLTAQKIYFEHFEIWGGNRANDFVNYWKKNGDLKELEDWLFLRRDKPRWHDEWVRLKLELGTANVIFDELEQEIRQNPNDISKIQQYFWLVGNKRSVLWLLDVVPTTSAYKTYLLATKIGNISVKQKLLEKSLILPFPEEEKEKFLMDCSLMTQLGITPKNPDKQLRFWAKKALIGIHLATNQPLLARPYAEELAALDTSDILWKDEIFINAGATQLASGKRVIEAQILQNEEEKKDSLKYWLERIDYYKGRKEENLVWDSYQKALNIFQYNPKDEETLKKRLEILREFRWEYDKHPEKLNIFQEELKRSKNNPIYLFGLSKIVLLSYVELREKTYKFFSDPNIIIRMMKARQIWDGSERDILQSLMDTEIWSAKQREYVWDELTKFANQRPSVRITKLAYFLFETEQYERAIPILQESLELMPKSDETFFTVKDLQEKLFEAYLKVRNWQAAERLAFEMNEYVENRLSEIADSLISHGNFAEGIRLWKLKSNLDRRNLYKLESLAQTSAKPLLKEFYLEMKQKDPLCDIPDKALQILK